MTPKLVLLHGHHDGRLVAVGGQAVRLHADAHRPPAAFHAAGHAELAREGARFRRGIAPPLSLSTAYARTALRHELSSPYF